MRNGKPALILGTALTLLVSAPAVAEIIGGAVTGGTALAAGGVFVKLTTPLPNPFGPPDSVGNDNFQSPNLYGFDEDQNILIGSVLGVDVGTAPAVGTTVASHYIFFDPGPTQEVIGTVNFDSDVIAIITGTANLAASDFLANTGVNYLDPAERGLELGDSVTISGPRQILFDTVASSPGDYVRVLTEFSPGTTSVPEPGTLPLLGICIAAIAAFRYRRRAA
jgi:PEP-CTERM motif